MSYEVWGLAEWHGAEGQAGQKYRAIEDHRDAVGVGRDDVHLGELAGYPDGYVKPPVAVLGSPAKAGMHPVISMVPAHACALCST